MTDIEALTEEVKRLDWLVNRLLAVVESLTDHVTELTKLVTP